MHFYVIETLPTHNTHYEIMHSFQLYVEKKTAHILYVKRIKWKYKQINFKTFIISNTIFFTLNIKKIKVSVMLIKT